MKRTAILFFSLLLTGIISAQTPEELKAMLPIVDGWQISNDIEVFDKDNLYNRINGAAPLYFENNFREMTSMEYTKGDRYITVQAYRHASPEDAFGMYASERSSEMTFYEGIGGEAQGDEYGLYFFVACMYIKIMAGDESEDTFDTMQEIARNYAYSISTRAGYPELFGVFPAKGLLPHSFTYITNNYIGHEFLKPAYTADYIIDNRKYQVFIIDGKTESGAKEILTRYSGFTGQGDLIPSPEGFIIKDRYNGNIPVLWNGRYITGAFDENGEDFPDWIFDFLKEINLHRE